MAVKIRLQRYGRKKSAFFHIVVADNRAPRDGKFIERLGSYNPNTNPATIELDFDKTFAWVKDGAQPTDTCRAILSYKGVLHRYHLHRGVVKGAFTEEQAQAKFEEWLTQKTTKIEGKKTTLAEAKETSLKERLERESKIKQARAERIAAKNTPPAEEPAAEVEASAPAEEPAAENTETTPTE